MPNEATTPAQESAAGDVHRLRDILVEEVSLVDRAANKRRFLVVKRSNEMSEETNRSQRREAGDEAADPTAGGRAKKKPKPGQKADKARRGAAAAASDQDDDDDEDDEEMEKADRRPPPWEKDDDDGEDDDETEKADEDDEDDDETEKADDDEEEDEDEDDDDDETEKEDDEDDEEDEDDEAKSASGQPAARKKRRAKPTEKAGGDLVLSPAVKPATLGGLTKALERLLGVASRLQKAGANSKAKASVPGAVAHELEAIGKLLADVTERLPVAKAGRRMAKDRLDRFQKALSLLSDVLKELTHAQQAADPAGGGSDNKAQKRTDVPSMGTLVASVTELTQLMKGQQEELTRLRKMRGTSNAITVDGSRPRAIQDVSWPLDMNRPISRDGVAKATSFFDD